MAKLNVKGSKVKDVLRVLKENGFVGAKKGSTTHRKYYKGKYVFTFTERDMGRDVSPAQIKELNKILEQIKKDEHGKG